MPNEWTKPEHAEAYLARMKDVPHRAEGESTLLSEIPPQAARVLDLGCGNGHLLTLVLAHSPQASGVGLDFSPTMLEQARRRFGGDERVTLVKHNLDEPLPDLGTFDCVVSSFAIHHCTHERKRELYAEVFALLEPGGVFCNLEHVASPTQRIHERFLEHMGIAPQDEDPSNKLLDVETQLRWLRDIGFEDVDCCWKWRELALLSGRKPSAPRREQDRTLSIGSSADAVPIVPMTNGHLEHVIGLWQATDGLLLSDVDSPEHLARYLARNPGLSHVAIRGDQIIGAVLCGHDGRRGFLYHLAVAPGHRNQGVGRALVRACLCRLKEAGYSRCNLFVLDGNTSGRQFWSSDGWYDWPDIRLMSKDCDNE